MGRNKGDNMKKHVEKNLKEVLVWFLSGMSVIAVFWIPAQLIGNIMYEVYGVAFVFLMANKFAEWAVNTD